MSKIQSSRSPPDSADADFGATTTSLSSQVMGGATTTLVRADARPIPENMGELHPQLKAQLRELRLRTGRTEPDVPMLLRLINDHYQTSERERRGFIDTADECVRVRSAHERHVQHAGQSYVIDEAALSAQ